MNYKIIPTNNEEYARVQIALQKMKGYIWTKFNSSNIRDYFVKEPFMYITYLKTKENDYEMRLSTYSEYIPFISLEGTIINIKDFELECKRIEAIGF